MGGQLGDGVEGDDVVDAVVLLAGAGVEYPVDDVRDGVVFRQRMHAVFVQKRRLAASRTLDAARNRAIDRMRDQIVRVDGRGCSGGGG